MTTGTMTITIHRTSEMVYDEDGKRVRVPLLNARGKGQHVATITGCEAVDAGYGADWAMVEGTEYALGDALAFARRGEHGLSVVSEG